MLFANTGCLLLVFAPKVYHVIKKSEEYAAVPTEAHTSSQKRTIGSKKSQISSTTGSILQKLKNKKEQDQEMSLISSNGGGETTVKE